MKKRFPSFLAGAAAALALTALATSALVLGEPVTPLSAVGAALTVAGLALSEHKKGTAS